MSGERGKSVGFGLGLVGWFLFAHGANVFLFGCGEWWIALAISAVLSLPALAFAAVLRRRWAFATYGAATLLALGLAVLPWHPRKRFLDDLAALDRGMSVADVRARMARYEPRVVPPSNGTIAYRWDGQGGNFDADLGEVRFGRGHVVATRFLPD